MKQKICDDMETWRMLDCETSDSASMNLAIDEAIFLERIANRIPSTIRFWRNKRAVVIGRYQNLESEANLEVCDRESIQIVRRFSGGGAVFHDLGNLNYSLALASEDAFLKGLDLVETFQVLTRGIIEGFREYGLILKFDPPSDLLICDKKVSGNAQSRRRGIIFHHGTLLINTDLKLLNRVLTSSIKNPKNKHVVSRKRDVDNFQNYVNIELSAQKVKEILQRAFERVLSIRLVSGKLGSGENSIARILHKTKYSTKRWNFHAESQQSY